MTEKCFGGAALVADNAIDGGFAGYYDDGLVSSNNNTPAGAFQVDYNGLYITDRSGSGSSAKLATRAYHDQ